MKWKQYGRVSIALWRRDCCNETVCWPIFSFFSERFIRKCRNRLINLIDSASISIENIINCDAISYEEREAEKKNGCLTLQSCCPGDNSSNGWREKHFEHANNITCELIVLSGAGVLLIDDGWICVVCFSSKANTCVKSLSGHNSLCSLK